MEKFGPVRTWNDALKKSERVWATERVKCRDCERCWAEKYASYCVYGMIYTEILVGERNVGL